MTAAISEISAGGVQTPPESIPLRAIDRQFFRFLCDRYGANSMTARAGASASAALALGHSCLDLDEQCGALWDDESGNSYKFPSPEELIIQLNDTPLGVGLPGERKPLILDGRRLYIYKYFHFERRTAERLQLMSAMNDDGIPDSVIVLAKKLFMDEKKILKEGGQLQAAGALLPFFSRLSIISGGPGTGKTTVLTKLIALLCQAAADKGKSYPSIQLAAPTGKAAQRMRESIRAEASKIPDHDIQKHLRNQIPSTLHRLLGLYGDSPKPKRNNQSPIDADIVVIDEASMIDLAMFTRLIDALSDTTRLILLGDRYQLASINAGCVLGDICDGFMAQAGPDTACNVFPEAFADRINEVIRLPGNYITATAGTTVLSPVVELLHSYRFEGGGAIGVVSDAVNRQSVAETMAALRNEQTGVESCRLFPHMKEQAMADALLTEYEPLFAQTDPGKALDQLRQFMVLTAVNEGRFGRVGINNLILRAYKAKQREKSDVIAKDSTNTGGRPLPSIPSVRPIKITENSYSRNLFNGDMGVIIRTTLDGKTYSERAWFPSISIAQNDVVETEEDKKPRPFLIGALPGYVDAFAITIHNSQGSEFEKVKIMLTDQITQVLSKELLYTAITRAKTTAEIYGPEEVLEAAIKKRIERHSGLAKRVKMEHGD